MEFKKSKNSRIKEGTMRDFEKYKMNLQTDDPEEPAPEPIEPDPYPVTDPIKEPIPEPEPVPDPKPIPEPFPIPPEPVPVYPPDVIY